ncbi:MAG: hypothetical protein AB7Q81_24075 [Gammaproteobacteria bacterium]
MDRAEAGIRAHIDAIEQAVKTAPDEHVVFADDGYASLTFDDRRYAAGRFELPRIGTLKQALAASRACATGVVNLMRLGGRRADRDIGHLQANAPPGTLFQVASQFNCLESTKPCIVPIARYFSDPTQGPRASISAFPGTLLRHYRAPRPDGSRFVQANDDCLNLLHDAIGDAGARVCSGYLCTQDIPRPAALEAALEVRFDQLRVGLHDGIEVVLGRNWYGAVQPGTTIAQAFTSTIALGGYSFAHDDREFAGIRRHLLRAAYLGTLLGALHLGMERVVLTLIGGGAFDNPAADIWDAIHWASSEAGRYAASSLDVFVNVYEDVTNDHARRLPEAVLPSAGARG